MTPPAESQYVRNLLAATDYALSGPQVSVTDLVKACGVSKPVAQALLMDLAAWRIVEARSPLVWLRRVIILPQHRTLVRKLIIKNAGVPPKPNILAMRTVPGMTPAERRILPLIADGMRDAEIGRQLYVTRDTVSTHVKHMLADFSARNRTHLVSRAYQLGHLPDPYTGMSGKDGHGQ